jgi:Fe-S-cluster containining protein
MKSLVAFLKEKLRLGTEHAPGCHACGRCCEAFGGFLRASQADLTLWEKLGREDLLAHAGKTGWLWLDPKTGQRLEDCPYLRRNDMGQGLCAIHEIKPSVCRSYPSEAVGRRCVCGVYFPVSLWGKKTESLH